MLLQAPHEVYSTGDLSNFRLWDKVLREKKDLIHIFFAQQPRQLQDLTAVWRWLPECHCCSGSKVDVTNYEQPYGGQLLNRQSTENKLGMQQLTAIVNYVLALSMANCTSADNKGLVPSKPQLDKQYTTSCGIGTA